MDRVADDCLAETFGSRTSTVNSNNAGLIPEILQYFRNHHDSPSHELRL